jgi:hypothetical protein
MADEEPRTNHAIEVVEVPFYGDSIEAKHGTAEEFERVILA